MLTAAAGLVLLGSRERAVLILLAPLAVGTVILAGRAAPLPLDLIRDRVARVAGVVGIQARDRGGPLLVVGDRTFRTSDDLLDRISTGRGYSVYYLPLSRRILNWELLDIRPEPAAPQLTHPAARVCRVCGASATSTSDRRCRYCGAELPW